MASFKTKSGRTFVYKKSGKGGGGKGGGGGGGGAK
jgi:hypothetical protein